METQKRAFNKRLTKCSCLGHDIFGLTAYLMNDLKVMCPGFDNLTTPAALKHTASQQTEITIQVQNQYVDKSSKPPNEEKGQRCTISSNFNPRPKIAEISSDAMSTYVYIPPSIV